MVEEKYNTELKRSMAANIDAGIFVAFSFVMSQFIDKTDTLQLKYLLVIIVLFAPVLYSIVLHYLYGQTLGKVAFSLLVVDVDEERKLSLGQAIRRNSIYLLFAFGLMLYILYNGVLPDFAKSYAGILWQPLAMYAIAEVVTTGLSSKKRAIHDYLAGSVVINI